MSPEFIEAKPTTQTVHFAGRPLNLTRLAEVTPVSRSYLSMLFNGKREPSLRVAHKLSKELGMSLDEFVIELRKLTKAA